MHAGQFPLITCLESLCNDIPVQELDRPSSLQEAEAPRIHDDSLHMRAIRLSALPTSRLYPPGYIASTHL